MKANRFLYIILAGAAILCTQSCLKDQADVFEESSSARMQHFNENVQTTLLQEVLNNEHSGWILEYFPGTNQKLGGYVFYVKFSKDSQIFGTPENPVNVVTAISELNLDNECTSLYKLTTDNGPVLSFDSNNDVLHYFATPSSGEYQAKGGDFEFSVKDCTDYEIVMKGKRSGNKCRLVPFQKAVDVEYAYMEPSERSQVTPQRYLADVKEMSGSMRAASVEGIIGKQPVTGVVNLDNRRITFTLTPENDGDEAKEVVMPFTFTPMGIKAYEEITIDGNPFRELSYFSENNTLTNFVFTLKGVVPDDYASFNEFIGEFTLSYWEGKSLDIAIQAVDTKNAIMIGLNPNFVVKLSYDSARGRMRMVFQVLGSNGSNSIKWCPWDADAGYLTWLEDVGMDISLDLEDPSRKTFKFSDNKVWENYSCNSFVVYEFDSSGSVIDAYKDWGEYRFPYFESITRN